MKICTKCKVKKDLSEFSIDNQKKDKHRPNCKICHSKQNSKYNKTIPEKRKFYVLKSATGVTEEQYNNLLQLQDNKCAICNLSIEKSKKKLAIDHCHKTLKVRGLLCNRCNMGLGYFNDDFELLNSAFNYLKNSTNKDYGIKYKFKK